MKLTLMLVLVVSSLAVSQSSQPSGGGLVIAEVSFQEKMLKTPAIPKSMVSTEPPVIKPNPNLGRVDKNESPVNAEKQEKARLAAMSRVGGMSHDDKPSKEPPDPTRLFYVFTAQMKNDSAKTVTRVVWAYRTSHHPHMEANPDTEFLCSTKIAPGKSLEVKSTSRLPGVKVVDVSSIGSTIEVPKPSIKDFVVKQVQFSDGTTWQQPDWNPVILTKRSAVNLQKGKCITL